MAHTSSDQKAKRIEMNAEIIVENIYHLLVITFFVIPQKIVFTVMKTQFKRKTVTEAINNTPKNAHKIKKLS